VLLWVNFELVTFFNRFSSVKINITLGDLVESQDDGPRFEKISRCFELIDAHLRNLTSFVERLLDRDQGDRG
jgi:hypothetical protein